MKDIVDLKKVRLQMLNDSTLIVQYKDGFTIEQSDAEEIDAMQITMCREHEVGMVVDIRNIENIVTKEAREFFTKKGKMLSYTKAVAIIQKGKQKNIETGILSFFNKPLYPTKSFENMEEALAWLENQ